MHLWAFWSSGASLRGPDQDQDPRDRDQDPGLLPDPDPDQDQGHDPARGQARGQDRDRHPDQDPARDQDRHPDHFHDRMVSSSKRHAVAYLASAVATALAIALPGHASDELLISEFMAVNTGSLLDRYGESSDWVEIFNPSTNAVDMTDWSLTDDPGDLDKWSFPATNIAPRGFLVVFASGRDEALPGQELHTSFRLSGGGEYLALVKPDGITVSHRYAPAYPEQRADISFGLKVDSGAKTLIESGQLCTYLVPSDGTLGTTWIETGFDDSGWSNGVTGLGFGSEFEGLIGTDLSGQMNGTVYLRQRFTIDAPADITSLRLKLKYADGYVATLNGHVVAATNAPPAPAWDSYATVSRASSLALAFETHAIPDPNSVLVAGTNTLAIQGLRLSRFYSLLLPELESESAGIRPGSLQRYFATATPGALNTDDFADFVADTRFSRDRGFYTNPVSVAISCETEGSTIYYTLDGSAPGVTPGQTNGMVYTAPLTITNTTTLRAVAERPGYEPSNVDCHTYIFPEQVLRQPADPPGFPDFFGYDSAAGWPEDKAPADYEMDPEIVTNTAYAQIAREAFYAIPTVSLVMNTNDLFTPSTDPAIGGIYANPLRSGVAWERPGSAEFICLDARGDKQVNCGVRIYGGWNRRPDKTPKHTFRFLFKGAYGPTKLTFPLFGDDPSATDTFDTLNFRSVLGEHWLHPGRHQRAVCTMLRDQFARHTQLAMGRPSSHGVFVHFYINGLYWGLYESVERPSAPFQATYFGGDKDDWDALNGGGAVDGDTAAWNTMVALANAGVAGSSEYEAIQGYLDIPNFIDYMLVEYYTGHLDWDTKNWYSARYRAPGAGYKFFCWDVERSLEDVNENRLGLNRNNKPTGIFHKLKENAEFRLQLADRMQRHCFNGGVLTPEVAAARWMEGVNEIDKAIVLESARWGDHRRDVDQRDVGPYELYTRNDHWLPLQNQLVNDYFPQRTGILVQQFRDAGLFPSIDAPVFNTHGGMLAEDFQLVMSADHPIYYTLDGSDPRVYGTGAITGVPYATPVPLEHTALAKARARTASGEWSALTEAWFVAEKIVPVRITEVMYNPGAPRGSETNSATTAGAFEFVEIRNTGSNAVWLAGLRFDDAIDFDFSSSAIPTLAPGEHAVVVRNLAAFTNRYGSGLPIAGEFQQVHHFPLSSLDDAGERIVLADALGRTLSSFTYNDTRAWPAAADGAGHSLVPDTAVTQEDGLLDYPGYWRASAFVDGSPGRADPLPPRDIMLNEFAAHTDYTNAAMPEYDSNDWIELFNTASSGVSLAGWFLSDSASDLRKWALPDVMLAGRDWISFDEVTGFHSPITNGFGLDKAGEQLFLSYLPGGTNDRVADAIVFKGQENGMTLGRSPDGDGPWQTLLPTRGTANGAPPTHVIISEIMYHPVEDEVYEYIELHNPSGTPADLWTAAGTWRLDGGVSFSFPSNTALEAGSYLVVVPFDPTNTVEAGEFLGHYGLTSERVHLVGPYGGRLANGGERIGLERPQGADAPGEGISWVVVDEVWYFDRSPWSEDSDGTGRPLLRRPHTPYGNTPQSWTTGASASPGNAPLGVGLATPIGGTAHFSHEPLELTATLDDEFVLPPVHHVDLYQGAQLLVRDATPPYAWTVAPPLSTGAHVFAAAVTDNAGTRRAPDVEVHVYHAPLMDNADGATGISEAAAQLNGTQAGGESDMSFICWGSTDGGTNRSRWEHVVEIGPMAPGGLSRTIAVLQPGHQYFYRCGSTRFDREFWADSAAVFHTVSPRHWPFRMKIQFDPPHGATPLADIPVLIRFHEGLTGFAYSDFASPSDGADLRFADAGEETFLNFEIEKWNTNGESIVWVRIPELSDAHDSIWAYWGRPVAVPGSSTDGAAWESGYAAVWHLDGDPGDSSSPAYDGNANGASDAIGIVGGGKGFDGTNDYVTFGDINAMDSPAAFTVSLWFKRRSSRTDQSNHNVNNVLVAQCSNNNNDNLEIGTESEYVEIYLDTQTEGGTPARFNADIQDGQWRHVAVVYDRNTADGLVLYVDGAEAAQWTAWSGALASSQGSPLSLGIARAGSDDWGDFDGLMDEVRVSTTARSAEWIHTCWLNIASGGVFAAYSPVEDASRDTDGDGLPDLWEVTHFGTLGATSGLATEDWDGDGSQDADEYAAGTDPVDPASHLAIVGLAAETSGETVIRWQSVSSRTYALQFRADLITGQWQHAAGPVTAEAPFAAVTNAPGAPSRFYRVSVVPE